MKFILFSIFILLGFGSCSNDSLKDNIEGEWNLFELKVECIGKEAVDYNADIDGCVELIISQDSSITVLSKLCVTLIFEEDIAYWKDNKEDKEYSYVVDESSSKVSICLNENCLTLVYEDETLSFAAPQTTIANPEVPECINTFIFRR